MNFSLLAKRIGKLTADNSPAILTGLGIAGTLSTAYLAGKASFKAAEIIAAEEVRGNETSNHGAYLLDARSKFNLTWKLYIPAAATGALTIATIFGANHVSTRRATAMATAYSISERAFSEYKEKVVEKIGENKERAVRDEIAQDRVNRNEPEEGLVIITDNGDVLCYDQYTGRYFKSSMETLKRAANEINYLILHQGYASLTDFYHEVGLPRTEISDEVGWNTDQLLELDISTTLSVDSRPCLAINFNLRPHRKFDTFSC